MFRVELDEGNCADLAEVFRDVVTRRCLTVTKYLMSTLTNNFNLLNVLRQMKVLYDTVEYRTFENSKNGNE